MALQDFLAPNEEIRYNSPTKVKHADIMYDLYITTDKLILHSQSGLIFKKDTVIAHRLDEIQTMQYREGGIFPKKGILDFSTKEKKIPIMGRPDNIKALWQELQKFIKA